MTQMLSMVTCTFNTSLVCIVQELQCLNISNAFICYVYIECLNGLQSPMILGWKGKFDMLVHFTCNGMIEQRCEQLHAAVFIY